jgi:hypothetical protein
MCVLPRYVFPGLFSTSITVSGGITGAALLWYYKANVRFVQSALASSCVVGW